MFTCSFADDGAKYYIYIPQTKIKVYKPSEIEVIDQELTNEVWCTEETPVIKVGALIVLGGVCNDMIEKQGIYLPKTDFIWSKINIK